MRHLPFRCHRSRKVNRERSCDADMMELVDIPGLGSGGSRLAGSSPAIRNMADIT